MSKSDIDIYVDYVSGKASIGCSADSHSCNSPFSDRGCYFYEPSNKYGYGFCKHMDGEGLCTNKTCTSLADEVSKVKYINDNRFNTCYEDIGCQHDEEDRILQIHKRARFLLD